MCENNIEKELIESYNNLADWGKYLEKIKVHSFQKNESRFQINTDAYIATFNFDCEIFSLLHHSFNYVDRKLENTPYKQMGFFFHKIVKLDKVIQTQINSDDTYLISDAISIGFVYCGLTKSFNSEGDFVDVVILYLTREVLNTVQKNKLKLLPESGLSDGMLTLRVTSIEDSYGLYYEQKDPTTRHWSIFPEASFNSVHKEAKLAELKWLTDEKMSISIIENESNELVGRINLRPVIPPKVADVGYGIFPKFRGKGYAIRALNLFSNWAFSSADYARIELGIKEGNIASERAAIGAGYELESICRGRLINNDGTFSDQLSYVKLNPNIIRNAINIKE
ncbi:GNAT family N-acetyltransferase [Photorhabdus tasmaniensis]|uniref:GNAT family N-acetyltransferase n=1 Tax=Photorhabdus tasmaniensis TaxID=1004159 RepID=UPI0040436B43